MAVEVDALRNFDDLAEVNRSLHGRQLVLEFDLRPLASGDSKRFTRIDADTAAAFANLLLSVRRTAPIVMWLPELPALLRPLVRAGLLFALGQRPGAVTAFLGDQPAPDLVEHWRGTWNPNATAFRHRVTGSVDTPDDDAQGADLGDAVSAGHVIFKNPHLAVARERLATEVSDNLAVPWVRRVVGAASPQADKAWLTMFSDAAGSVIRELLFNLAVHPFAPLTGVQDLEHDRRRAYVSLFSTRGGGEKSHNRVHVVVADTGHGIARTLRPKLRQLGSDTATLDPGKLLTALLEQTLPSYGHAEGFGFGRIIDLVQRFGGTLHLLTSADDDIGGSIDATHSSGKSSARRLPTFDCFGTIAHAVLSLEGATLQREQPQLFTGVGAG